MTTGRTDQLLEQILEELRQIKDRLGDDANIASPAIPSIPNIPRYPSNPPAFPVTNIDRCSRCGIVLTGVMGYVCSDPSCPTGFGPAISKVGP